jgi:hypothetical protein
MGLILPDDEGRSPALGRQPGVTLLGDEGDIPGSCELNGSNALNYQVGRTLKLSPQKDRQFAKGAFHGGR